MTQSGIDLPRGFALNEYRIESTLGVGGFGLTYLATDSNLALKVAIKEYLPAELALRGADHSVTVKSAATLESFNWGRSRFIDESRTLASFQHANIVRVMRFFEANQTAYMVMEFVDGKALNEWVTPRRPLSEAAVLAIAGPLLDGLEVVHRGGYLHRDIKPGNIYIREDGSPVLLDFGSARTATPNTELTAIVTPGYAPLEQYHSHGRQGPWTDIYSVGAVLYWAVTGYKPIESTARARADPLMPAAQAGDLARYSMPLLKAIDWALAPAEEARPQSVAHLRAALPARGNGGAARAGPQDLTVVADDPMSRPESTSLTSAVFGRETLDAIAADLAPHIGPIAPMAVRSAARKVMTLARLAELLGKEIADESARAAFVKKYAAAAPSSPFGAPSRPASSRPPSAPPSAPVSGPAATFDAAVLAKAEVVLAQHIGAVAKIVVRRAAAKARDEPELYLMIADEIEDKDEKKRFIRKAMSVARGS